MPVPDICGNIEGLGCKPAGNVPCGVRERSRNPAARVTAIEEQCARAGLGILVTTTARWGRCVESDAGARHLSRTTRRWLGDNPTRQSRSSEQGISVSAGRWFHARRVWCERHFVAWHGSRQRRGSSAHSHVSDSGDGPSDHAGNAGRLSDQRQVVCVLAMHPPASTFGLLRRSGVRLTQAHVGTAGGGPTGRIRCWFLKIGHWHCRKLGDEPFSQTCIGHQRVKHIGWKPLIPWGKPSSTSRTGQLLAQLSRGGVEPTATRMRKQRVHEDSSARVVSDYFSDGGQQCTSAAMTDQHHGAMSSV